MEMSSLSFSAGSGGCRARRLRVCTVEPNVGDGDVAIRSSSRADHLVESAADATAPPLADVAADLAGQVADPVRPGQPGLQSLRVSCCSAASCTARASASMARPGWIGPARPAEGRGWRASQRPGAHRSHRLGTRIRPRRSALASPSTTAFEAKGRIGDVVGSVTTRRGTGPRRGGVGRDHEILESWLAGAERYDVGERGPLLRFA